MNDLSVVFFGKPDSFEAFEFTLDGVSKISYSEPELKLEDSDQSVLHSYFKDGQWHLELYGYAKAHNSGRDGIVIGVALKSNEYIRPINVNLIRLLKLLGWFKKNALNGDMFKNVSLQNVIGKAKLDIIELAKGLKTKVFKPANSSSILILINPDFIKGMALFENHLLKYNNVYVTESVENCRSKLNSSILYKTNGKLFIVDGKKITGYEDPRKREVPRSQEEDYTVDEKDQLKNNVLKEKKRYIELERKFLAAKKRFRKTLTAIYTVSLVCILSAITFFFQGFGLFDNFYTPDLSDNRKSPANDDKEYPKEIALEAMFLDSIKLASLEKLIVNLKLYKESRRKKYYEAILRDCNVLGLNVDSLELHKPIEGIPCYIVKPNDNLTRIVNGINKEYNKSFRVKQIADHNGIEFIDTGNYYLIKPNGKVCFPNEIQE